MPDEVDGPPIKKPRVTSSPVQTSECNETQNDVVVVFTSNTLHESHSASTETDLGADSCGLNSSFLTCCSTQTVNEFDLKSTVEGDIVGRTILNKYRAKFTLDAKDRNVICDIIISHFLNRSFKLSNECLSILANKVVALFSASEKRITYYVSPVSKKNSRRNKPEVARGKLVDKHRNKLTTVRRALLFEQPSQEKNNFNEGTVTLL